MERVRLVLAAKSLPYQSVEVNLERRAKWHYLLNQGFVPILETPGAALTLWESRIVMEYLEDRYPGVQLYEGEPELKARQQMLMKVMDDMAEVLFVVIMSRGGSEEAVKKMDRVL